MRFTSLLVGVGDRRQPTPRPSPDRGGEKRVGSEEVGAGVLSQDCSAQLCA
ncbi:MAG: hypothetical protein F6K48_00875 [Okeania sp. SIO3H1]|nr:hypothetical protein [Okeania sp. SIO3H1]